jgi:competence protein ComEC
MLIKSGKHKLLLLVIILFTVVTFIFYLDYQNQEKKLTFAMLDVGQGDALFIESPTGVQVLVDVGPPRRVLSKLNRVMPLFDRTIDAIIITNPDTDHIGGVTEVLKAYKVKQIFEPGTVSDSTTYQNLKKEIEKRNIENILLRKGMKIDLGGGVVLDILFPDRDVTFWDTNEGSVVARLTYGETSILLTGDSTWETEKILLGNPSLDTDILKVGHHGSRTSTSYDFVKKVSPEYALISNGRDNSYGHPHEATLDTLKTLGVKVLRTDQVGTIILKSDGLKKTFSFKK